MQEQVRVAAIALNSRPGRTDENLQNISNWCERAAAAGAQLVLFPELSVTGFLPNHPRHDHAQWLEAALKGAWEMAVPVRGAVVERLAQISRDCGVFVAAGILEHAGNVLFNTHVLAGEGRIYGWWRKMHVPLFEMALYNGGGVPEVVETPLGRIGANICFDAFLPESTRLLAVQQAEIVLFPFAADPAPATAAGWAAWARPVMQARCMENGVFGLGCNCRGPVEFAGAAQEFFGGGMLVSPDGSVLGEMANGQLLTGVLESRALGEARAKFEYTYRYRRPELYGSLARVR